MKLQDVALSNDVIGQLLNVFTVSDVGIYVDTKEKIESKIDIHDVANVVDNFDIGVGITLNDQANSLDGIEYKTDVVDGKVTIKLKSKTPHINITNQSPKIIISQKGLL